MKVSSRKEWFDDLFAGFLAYHVTTLPVLVGVLFGMEFLDREGGNACVQGSDPIAACIHFDAISYQNIIRHGYSYDPTKRSLVATFPAYPLLGRWIAQATGLQPGEAALLVANLAPLLLRR